MKGLKGLIDEFNGFLKSRKRSIFLIDFQIKGSEFTALKRDVKF